MFSNLLLMCKQFEVHQIIDAALVRVVYTSLPTTTLWVEDMVVLKPVVYWQGSET